MDKNEKLMIAMGQAVGTGDVPTVIIGIPDAADRYIRGTGLTHTIDLRKLGIPAKVLVFAGATHDECVDVITRSAASFGSTVEDRRKPGQADLGIDEPTIN